MVQTVAVAQTSLELPAQPPSAPVTTHDAEAPIRFPRLLIGFGVGSANDPWGTIVAAPMQTASAQVLVGRHFVVEAEVSRWATDEESDHFVAMRRGWSLGANFLYRTEPRRVAWFAGGGPFFGNQHEVWEQFGDDVKHTDVFFQALTGLDVGVAGPVRAYSSLQFTTMPRSYVRVSAGVRIVALTQRADADAKHRADIIAAAHRSSSIPINDALAVAAAAAGKAVTISFADGSRSQGRLISLTAAEVGVRDDNRDLKFPLDSVLMVETVHHKAWKGTAAGAAAGAVLTFAELQCTCDWGPEVIAWPAMGAGIGALVGAMIDRALAGKHVIYAASATIRPPVQIAPVVARDRGGLAVTMRW